MRLLFCLFVVLAILPAAVAQAPVVVELFTSEGCSSCPPADALLVQLSQMKAPNGSEIIVLGEHVDYWNQGGWTDRFSSAEFTQRQQGYERRFDLATAYTPQAVIDGTVQFVGNDRTKLEQAILQQSRSPKPATVSLRLEAPNKLHVNAHVTGAGKSHVFLAITEDGLTSKVAGGENQGRTLQHAGVVRSLRDLGELHNAEFDKNVPVNPGKDWNTSNLKVLVWVQQVSYGSILGAASTRLAESGQNVMQASTQ